MDIQEKGEIVDIVESRDIQAIRESLVSQVSQVTLGSREFLVTPVLRVTLVFQETQVIRHKMYH